MGMELVSRVLRSAKALLTSVSIHALSLIVFGFFDIVDQVLCPVFSYLDWFLDRREVSCYCYEVSEVDNKKLVASEVDCEYWEGHSNTLLVKKHKKRRSRVHLLTLHRSLSSETIEPLKNYINPGRSLLRSCESGKELVLNAEKTLNSTKQSISQQESLESSLLKSRWSDCGCATCTAWHSRDDLYVRLGGKATEAPSCEADDDSENNVIFIHGFLASSSWWSETVFPEFSDSLKSTHRLFAVDVLGFGRSPKPTNCHYSMADHIQMIRISVIDRYKLKKYHLVAHSMGCTIALALAGHDPSAVRSVTIISPPYYPAISGSQPSSHLLKKVAPRKIWPVFAFGPSVMSWYEHLGRVVCLVVCRNHRFWEPVLHFTCNKILRWRVPHFLVHDFMQHTHNAAWHLFHNTICSGAYTTEWSMKALQHAGKRVRVIHGDNDNICPLQCGLDLKKGYSNVHLSVVPGANHVSILLGREQPMALELEEEIFRN